MTTLTFGWIPTQSATESSTPTALFVCRSSENSHGTLGSFPVWVAVECPFVFIAAPINLAKSIDAETAGFTLVNGGKRRCAALQLQRRAIAADAPLSVHRLPNFAKSQKEMRFAHLTSEHHFFQN